MKIFKNNFFSKVFYPISILSLFSIFLLLSSCSDANKTQAVIENISEVEPKTDAGKTYQKFMVTTLKFAEKSVDLLAKYDIGIPKDYATATAEGFSGESGTGVMNMEDILSSLPEDLSTVTRKRTTKTEVDGVMMISEEEVTLEEELAELEVEINNVIKEIQPDITEATTLDFVSRVDNNTIQVDNTIIRNDDLGGAITIELLNAEARGEDVDAILADMEIVTEAINDNSEDADEIEKEEGVSPTGTFQNDIGRWKSGTIYYYFQPVQQGIRDATLKAMREWETLTGVLYFRECRGDLPPNVWAVITGVHCVAISTADLSGNDGQASPGFRAYSQRILQFDDRFDKSYLDNFTKNSLQGTARHELGHVIGLDHEHQRPDRDAYISTTKNSSSYNKLQDKHYFSRIEVRWSRKLVRIWFIRFHIYYPEFFTVQKSTQINQRTSDYDYFSVMHYDNIKSKDITNIGRNHLCSNVYNHPTNIHDSSEKCLGENNEHKTGIHILNYNNYITNKDISAVKKMYRGSWE